MIVDKKGFCASVVLLGILLQGCVTSPNKALVKNDLQSVNQIKVIRYEFPGYMKETTGSKVASIAIAAPFMIFGAIGGGIGGGLSASVKSSMMTTAGKEMQSKYNLPDFAELVHKEFADKLPKAVPDLPEIVEEPGAANDDYQNPSECVLSIRSLVIVSDGEGFQAQTAAQLVDSSQNILWKKKTSYRSSDLDRPCEFEELEADDGKALHGEIAFAVEKTVSELIDHIVTGIDVEQPVKAVKQTHMTEQKVDPFVIRR
ncbi:MAG: hypothetical protein LLG97_17900 [Deltaproteobacteria bacterium]|nr:hypothetical protein [Deltaproteobacteria bacterium]